MNSKTIITIGRQYGSGGHEIGKRLADELQVPFYDKALLSIAAKESGLPQDLFENYDEIPSSSLLYSLSMGNTTGVHFNLPIQHKLFLAQADAIKSLADKGSCVFVGRCADYVLQQYPHVVNLFICGSMKKRIKRVSELYQLLTKEAEEAILLTDKRRSNYYNFFTNKKWGVSESYQLSIDSSVIGTENAVQLIHEFVDMKDSHE